MVVVRPLVGSSKELDFVSERKLEFVELVLLMMEQCCSIQVDIALELTMRLIVEQSSSNLSVQDCSGWGI